MRAKDILLSVAFLVASWLLAFLVMLNDIDFFSFHDLVDFSEPHHEHIVIVLLIGGILSAAVFQIRAKLLEREPLTYEPSLR